MNSNFSVFLSALATIFLLGVFWYIFYISHLKKMKSKYAMNDFNKNNNNKLLFVIKPEIFCNNLLIECPTELPNTDDDISEALNYIQPSKYASDLLEKMYEQARI